MRVVINPTGRTLDGGTLHSEQVIELYLHSDAGLAAEPTSEWQPRDVLRAAHDFDGVTAGSLPKDGTTSRVGQFVTVLVKPESGNRSSGSSRSSSNGESGDRAGAGAGVGVGIDDHRSSAKKKKPTKKKSSRKKSSKKKSSSSSGKYTGPRCHAPCPKHR